MTRIILASIGIIIVLMFYLYERNRWRKDLICVNAIQKKLRTISAIILIIILAMIAAGDSWLDNMLLWKIIYWLACLILTAVLIVITMVDVHNVNKSINTESKSIIDDLVGYKRENRDDDTVNSPKK